LTLYLGFIEILDAHPFQKAASDITMAAMLDVVVFTGIVKPASTLICPHYVSSL